MGWADNKADEMDHKEDAQRREQEFYLSKRQQIQAEAPRIWESLKETLHNEVVAFNKRKPDIVLKMDADYKGMPSVTLESEVVILVLSFDKAAVKIDASIGSPHTPHRNPRMFGFEVRGGKVVVGGDDDHGKDHSGIQAVAESILNSLIW